MLTYRVFICERLNEEQDLSLKSFGFLIVFNKQNTEDLLKEC